jgi:hypothetical protein
MVPETKGFSLEEIEANLDQRAANREGLGAHPAE